MECVGLNDVLGCYAILIRGRGSDVLTPPSEQGSSQGALQMVTSRIQGEDSVHMCLLRG
jgi:hypothetical protein